MKARMLAIVNNYCADLSINKKRYNLRICRCAGEIPVFFTNLSHLKTPKNYTFLHLACAEFGVN